MILGTLDPMEIGKVYNVAALIDGRYHDEQPAVPIREATLEEFLAAWAIQNPTLAASGAVCAVPPPSTKFYEMRTD